MSNAVPKPETLRATLVSEGYHKPTWTTHHFVEARPIVLPPASDVPGNPGGDAWEFIYECFKTGAQRRWGTVGVDQATDEADDASAEG